jgi:hypothetical protein
MIQKNLSDNSIQELVRISPFWRAYVALRQDWVLPPAIAAFVRQYKATSFPAQRLAMIRGALLAEELAGVEWPEAAKRRAVPMLDKVVREYDERLSRPVESLTIPQKERD